MFVILKLQTPILEWLGVNQEHAMDYYEESGYGYDLDLLNILHQLCAFKS